MEEHLLSGGFGSWLLEMGLNCKCIALDSSVCGEVGTQDYLKSKFNLNKKSIIQSILQL